MSDNKNKSTSLNNMIFCGIAAIIIIIFFVWLHENTDDTSNDRNIDAWVCAQNAVQEELKSPSSADFCTYPEATIKDRGNDKYSITGWVDADNSFGANIRTDFTVKLTLTSKGYKDAQCYFGDDSLWAIAEDVVQNQTAEGVDENDKQKTTEEKRNMRDADLDTMDVMDDALIKYISYLDITFEESGLTTSKAVAAGNTYKLGEAKFLGEPSQVYVEYSHNDNGQYEPTNIFIAPIYSYDLEEYKFALSKKFETKPYDEGSNSFEIEIPDNNLIIQVYKFSDEENASIHIKKE